MNIDRIPLDMIDMGDRLRTPDPDRVLMLMASATTDGIRQPIEVRASKTKGRYLLVTGGHRLTAALELGHADIPAIVLPKMSDDEARLIEINENVYRAELSELDRAVFLAEKKAIHERLFPQVSHGGQDRDEDGQFRVAMFGHTVERFTKEVRERLDLSERTLRRIVRRATIAKDVRDRIAATPFAHNGSELDALAKLDAAAQRTAVNLVFSGRLDAPRTIAAAVALVSGKRKAVVPDDDLQLAALMKAWKAAGARARRRFVDALVEEDDPHIVAGIEAGEREAA